MLCILIGVYQLSNKTSPKPVTVHDIHSQGPTTQSLFWQRLPSPRTRLYGSDHPLTLFDKQTTLWRLDSLSYIFDCLPYPVSGVTSPFVYFGSSGSCFALHTEYLDLHFASFLHSGESKIWYAIRRSSEHDLLALVDRVHPDSSHCQNILRHKDLLNPELLYQNHISFDTIVQEPGQFVISLPRCYHQGFNLGVKKSKKLI